MGDSSAVSDQLRFVESYREFMSTLLEDEVGTERNIDGNESRGSESPIPLRLESPPTVRALGLSPTQSPQHLRCSVNSSLAQDSMIQCHSQTEHETFHLSETNSRKQNTNLLETGGDSRACTNHASRPKGLEESENQINEISQRLHLYSTRDISHFSTSDQQIVPQISQTQVIVESEEEEAIYPSEIKGNLENSSQVSNGDSPSKRTRVSLGVSSKDFVVGRPESFHEPTFESEDSSIFSSRWSLRDPQCSFESKSQLCSLDSSAYPDSSLNSEHEEEWCAIHSRDGQGWDEKWAADIIPSLPGFEDSKFDTARIDQALIFSRVEQNLREEDVDSSSMQFVFSSFLRIDKDLSLAPSCDRLRRRLLHRPSQETTQTIAAPISTLDWIRRTQRPRDDGNRYEHAYLFGMRADPQYVEQLANVVSRVQSIAEIVGRTCRDLNLASMNGVEAAGATEAWTCGWMSASDRNCAFHQLHLVLNSLETIRLGNNGSSDCLDVMCYVNDRQSSNDVLMCLHSIPGIRLYTKEFDVSELPLYSRAVGAWKVGSLGRCIIIDIKVVANNSSWNWAVERFFSNSREQIRDILIFAASTSTSTAPIARFQRGNFGLADFIHAIKLLGRRIPIDSWDSLLRVYSGTSS